MQLKTKPGIVWLIMTVLVSLSVYRGSASAQQYFNNYQYIIGERAAGMGGAYTAIANDSTALWYNPAGLARISDMHLNISGNTYSYLKTTTEGFYQLPKKDGGSESINMEESDFSVVANTLIFGKKVGDNQAISFGLFIPSQDTLLESMELKEATNLVGGGKLSFKDDSSLNSKFYLAMLGYGAQIDNDLNVGASIGLGYYNATYKGSGLLYDTDLSDYESLEVWNTNIDNTQYTIQAGFGAQLKSDMEIDKNHILGFYVQTPTYRLSGEGSYRDVCYAADTETSGYTDSSPYCDYWTEDKFEDDPFKQVLPAFISLGYGYEEPDSFNFSLDIVPVFTVSGDDTGRYKNPVVNIKAGLESYLTKSVILRAGLFTDFSQKDDVKTREEDVGEDKINYYGGTLSISLGKHLMETEIKEDSAKIDIYGRPLDTGVKKKENKAISTPIKRTLWSTFGVIARYGMGDVVTTKYDENYDPTYQKKDLNFQAFIAESMSF